MSFAVAEALGGGFETLHNVVRAGEFDRLLACPLPVFFQVMASQVEAHRVGRFAQGVVAVAVATTWAPSRSAPLRWHACAGRSLAAR
jgi:ABC-type uncharacterized transport system permease subunit